MNTGRLPGIHEHTVMVNGKRIHVLERGQGEQVLFFIHGNSESALNWEEIWSALPDSFHLVAYDLPGHGTSERDWTAQHVLPYQAQVAVSLLAELGIERAVWIGHSQGGGVSLSASIFHPEYVEGLVLVASVAFPFVERGTRRQGITRLVPRRPRWWFTKFIESRKGQEIVERIMKQAIRATMYPASYDLTQPVWRRDAQIWSQPTHIVAANDDLLLLSDSLAELAPRYPEVQVPVEVVSGKQDLLIPLKTGEQLVQTVPDGHLTAIDEAGHFLIRSHAGEVRESIIRFVRHRLGWKDLVQQSSVSHRNSTNPDVKSPESALKN